LPINHALLSLAGFVVNTLKYVNKVNMLCENLEQQQSEMKDIANDFATRTRTRTKVSETKTTITGG